MKRLLRSNGRRGGNADPQSPPDPHSPDSRPRRQLGGDNPHASQQQQQQQQHMSRVEPVRNLTRDVSSPEGRTKDGCTTNDRPLPVGWNIEDASLMHSDPLCITMRSSTKTTVYADRNISKSLRQPSTGRPGRRRIADAPHNLGPTDHDSGPTLVYYFEVLFHSNHSSSVADIAIGLMCETDTFGAWPGELANSIGWGSEGLNVNGRRLDAAGSQSKISFRNGEVIGCGIELGGTHKVFFTRNGVMMVPPSRHTAFVGSSELPWYPVVSFHHGNNDIIRGNFGTNPSTQFRWSGSARMSIVSSPAQARGHVHTMSMGNLPSLAPLTSSPKGRSNVVGGRSTLPSSYYSMQDLDSIDDPLSNGHQASITRSTSPFIGKPNNHLLSSQSAHTPGSTPISPSTDEANNSNTSYYGVQTTKRRNLVDEDPAEITAALTDHFNLNPPSAAQTPDSDPMLPPNPQIPDWPAPQGVPSSPDNASSTPALDNLSMRPHASVEPANRRGQRRQERASRRNQGGLSGSSHRWNNANAVSSSQHSPLNAPMDSGSLSRLPMSLPEPRSAVAGNVLLTTTNRKDNTQTATISPPAPLETKLSSVTVAAGDDVPRAKVHAHELLKAAKLTEIDGPAIRELLEKCKADQEKLQLKLSNALEEADAIEDLEELFAVNDGICTAIDAGNEALKKEKAQQKKKKKSVDGPTIVLLVENEDVFSLICMLRAPNEKRTAAALALMKFARENATLRNEIRSSGGMHSFLTLFRTKGATHELKVVASMAVAYILPSFVVSAQTSSSIGLKIIECLRFLAVTIAVDTEEFNITRGEMLKAASMGVNVLWINAIQPLLLLESTKDQATQNRPELRPTFSLRLSRGRGRAGGGIFDQGQESIEIRELTELAVTLITHLAKISDSPSGDPLDVGYNIVEQVCEVDAARPIAVREGLLTTLVEWIRSKEVEKVRPAASALRYLISIKDKYMAGWIHSQVVNEGAVGEIVKLLTASVGHDVRVAVAQMISALCVAPHTRAAVVEARCVSYLVALLYEHNTPASAEVVRFAASALLQLAAGAMVRATALSLNGVTMDAATPDQQETVIT